MPRRVAGLGCLLFALMACEEADDGQLPATASSAAPDGVRSVPRTPRRLPSPHRPLPSLLACCQALQARAASGGDPARAMVKAAAICQAMAAQGSDAAKVVGAVGKELHGAAMPDACEKAKAQSK